MSCYRISIIIVTWNALHHLKNFLPAAAGSDYPDFEIVIADNASEDDTERWVRQTYPQIRYVRLDKNYGYCGGNNRAAARATGDILLFLNNDVEVTARWLHPVNRIFQEKPEAAVVQPKIRSYRNKASFEYAGAAGGFIDRFGYPFCRGRLFDTLEEDKGQYDDISPIFWASGAAMAIRRSLFEDSCGFDEDFEFHMEEIDLCWRLQNRGYAIYYVPDSVVYHLGGGSLQTGSFRKIAYNFRNNLLMLWKNEPASHLVLRLPVRLFLDALAGIRFLTEFHFKEFIAIINAYFRFIAMLPQTQKKRRKGKDNIILKRDLPGRMPVSLVWQYYVRGIRRFSGLPGAEK